MLIDWFTVGAQALNFIILVWLMKRFLYKPILAAIDAREKRIAAELADAAAKEASAQQERDEFKRKNEEFDRQRAQLLASAKDDADKDRRRLADEAREAADALSSSRDEARRNDARNLQSIIVRRTQSEVLAIARRALTDLAGASLEERMVALFAKRLREMDSPTKARLSDALKTASGPALIRTAFELPEKERAIVKEAVNELGAGAVTLSFETAPQLVGGIELTTNGQKLCWSVAEYLGSLEKEINAALNDVKTAQSDITATGTPPEGKASAHGQPA